MERATAVCNGCQTGPVQHCDEWIRARIARPSELYDEVVSFYRDLVGLSVVGSFADHDGYDGTIFGLTDRRFQLEVPRHSSGLPLPRPIEDDLLVLYFASAGDREEVEARLRDLGYEPVVLANPFWEPDSVSFRDPDGWIVVLTLDD